MSEQFQGRGALTDRIKEKSKELLGYEISLRELRLMAYLQYIMVNEQRFSDRYINDEEHDILLKWEESGYIKRTNRVSITKKFWDAVCEIIYLGYVDLTHEE